MHKEIFEGCKWGKIVILTIISILFLSLTASSFASFLTKIKGETIESISVSGTGEVSAVPDLALISFSVVTEKKTVGAAMSENTEKINAVIEAIKAQGVEDKDLQTTGFSLSPVYDYPEGLIYSSGSRTLTGYEVKNGVDVKVRKTDSLGAIIERATATGANFSDSLQFTFSDEDGLKNQAREKAIADAKGKADLISKQLGIRLKKVIGFYENYIIPYEGMKAYGLGGGSSIEASVPTIMTGENMISATVNINYEIK